MSAICQNFVQNAWKKDLCSNCFKSKDEHTIVKPKPVAIVSSNSIESIIKVNGKIKTKLNVAFTKDLTEVIGYGGEYWSDKEDDETNDIDDEDDDYDEDIQFSDDDQELIKLTKTNTDFNANLLNESNDNKKVFTNLMLGKPQLDSEGRKQTLLVSVTPFGQDASIKKNKTSHIPIAKNNNKDTLVETKTNVVLTSYSNKNEDTSKEEKSLLEEISETLENSKNPIQIVTRKKTQKDIILSISKPESNKENINKDNNNKTTTELSASDKLKEAKLNKSNIPERKIGITRAPVIKNQEKPAIFQTSVAKIELLNHKNLKLNNNKETSLIKSEPKIVKTEPNNNKEIAIETQIEENKKEIVLENVKNDKPPMGLPPPVPKFNPLPETREQVGEPDGRADSDEPQEPPALPLTPPPPLDTPNSFLHNNSLYDKPKIPTKPVPVPLRKIDTVSTFAIENVNNEESSVKLAKHDSNGSDIAKATNKRRAPKPPQLDESVIFNRNSMGGISLDSSFKENSERIKLEVPNTECNITRPSLSISIDSLNTNSEDKKKDKRTRFSLKKFLRMGSKTDTLKLQTEIPKTDETDSNKPRLVIVHPIDLNGAKVEVVAKPAHNEYAVPNVTTTTPVQEIYTSRGPKPLPPPRNFDEWKPLPHPPKSAEILNKQKQFSLKEYGIKKGDSVYANIGEVRSAIIPNKPQRTASMREREAQQNQNQKRKILENYEPIEMQRKNTENVYDYINSVRSSSPDSDSSPDKNSPVQKNGRLLNGLRSGSSIDVSGDYFKYQNIPRSLSLTYCGSETESEIYSPYSFYSSETEVII